VQVQAKQYYSFFAMTVLACGIVFQVPVGILSVTRLGIVKVEQLTKNRRYAYLICAVVAAALPGVDPISMVLETAPLIILYELSIVLAKVFGTPAERLEGQPQGS
jgi:sec-independent protein translocase protein TatC